MKSLTPVFGITTLIAGVAAGYLFQQLHTERSRTQALQNRVTELELAQTRRAAESPSMVASPASATPLASTAAQPAASTSVTATPALTAEPAATSANTNDLMKDPDFRASIEASLRQTLAVAYPDLAKELDLSPEQARKLLDVIASSTVSGMTMTTNSRGSTSVSAGSREEVQARRDNEIRGLLGESKLQQWKNYEQILPAHQQVVRLRTTLESSGANLSQRQQQQLIATIADEQKRQTAEVARMTQATGGPRNGPAAMEQMLQLTEASNQRILDASLAYLSPQQQDALKAQQNMELASTRAVLRMQRPRTESAGPQTGGP
jgi:hypothetical protein